MTFDPTRPVDNSVAEAAELRDQFNALKALLDAQAAQIADLQQQINNRALMQAVGEFDPAIHNPPTAADLEAFRDYIRDLAQQLLGETW